MSKPLYQVICQELKNSKLNQELFLETHITKQKNYQHPTK